MKEHWAHEEAKKKYTTPAKSDFELRRRGATASKSQQKWLRETEGGYYGQVQKDIEEDREELWKIRMNTVEETDEYVDWHNRQATRNHKKEIRAKELERVRKEEVSILQRGKDYVKQSTKAGFAEGAGAGGTLDSLGLTQGLGAPVVATAGATGAYLGSRRFVAKQNNLDRGKKIDREILGRKY